MEIKQKNGDVMKITTKRNKVVISVFMDGTGNIFEVDKNKLLKQVLKL